MDRRIKNLVLSSLFASLCCITTMVIQLPAPTGYVNLGDCAVLLSAWTLGPLWGAAAAGIGTMMADILNGWASYAPATFVIKFTMAAAAACISHYIRNNWGILMSAVAAESIMVLGYFLYESHVLSLGNAAIASLPANLFQGIVCLISAFAVSILLRHNRFTAKSIDHEEW